MNYSIVATNPLRRGIPKRVGSLGIDLGERKAATKKKETTNAKTKKSSRKQKKTKKRNCNKPKNPRENQKKHKNQKLGRLGGVVWESGGGVVASKFVFFVFLVSSRAFWFF